MSRGTETTNSDIGRMSSDELRAEVARLRASDATWRELCQMREAEIASLQSRDRPSGIPEGFAASDRTNRRGHTHGRPIGDGDNE